MKDIIFPSSYGVLTDDILATSEDFPNPEVIYAKGLWKCPDIYLSETEVKLGYKFPKELRSWYTDHGAGRITGYLHAAYNSPNNIIIPTHIPKLIDGTCGWMMPYTKIEPKTLPFFERDTDLFLCLKPYSENPNAVWWMWGEEMPDQGKICDSLTEFFERLVEDPDWFNPPR